MKIFYLSLTSLVLLTVPSVPSAGQGLPPASVYVRQVVDQSGKLVYLYRIKNSSTVSVTSLMVGFDYYHGLPELGQLPLGMGDLQSAIPASSAASPPGWTLKVTGVEDLNKVYLVWTANSPASALLPGQSLGGFGVAITNQDPAFSQGHWTLSLDESRDQAAFSSSLAPDTQCPTPRISFTLNPNVLWPPDYKLTQISAQISAQDDVDGTPAVTLDSITANENIWPQDVVASFGAYATQFQVAAKRHGNQKGGRIYTVTYSAHNSCGQSASAVGTITVPHDQSGR